MHLSILREAVLNDLITVYYRKAKTVLDDVLKDAILEPAYYVSSGFGGTPKGWFARLRSRLDGSLVVLIGLDRTGLTIEKRGHFDTWEAFKREIVAILGRWQKRLESHGRSLSRIADKSTKAIQFLDMLTELQDDRYEVEKEAAPEITTYRIQDISGHDRLRIFIPTTTQLIGGWLKSPRFTYHYRGVRHNSIDIVGTIGWRLGEFIRAGMGDWKGFRDFLKQIKAQVDNYPIDHAITAPPDSYMGRRMHDAELAIIVLWRMLHQLLTGEIVEIPESNTTKEVEEHISKLPWRINTDYGPFLAYYSVYTTVVRITIKPHGEFSDSDCDLLVPKAESLRINEAVLQRYCTNLMDLTNGESAIDTLSQDDLKQAMQQAMGGQ